MRRMVKVMSISPVFNLFYFAFTQTTATWELAMFLTAKLNVVSGMIIGALAVMAMKQMCKTRKTHKHSPVPAEPPQR